MTPALLMPKLYTNTVYMVLNSRIRIIGGRDTYTSLNDISITTTMIRGVTSQSGDGMQGQAPVVTIYNEVFSDNYEMSQINVSHGASCDLSELIFPEGQTTGWLYEPPCVTDRLYVLE